MRLLVALFLGLLSYPAIGTPLFGVNISGLEAGRGGKLGWTHAAPSQADITLAAQSGFRIARIPFKMERVAPGGVLDPSEFGALRKTVVAVRAAGMQPLVDDHSYGAQADPGALAAAWVKVASGLPGEVILGLQNEPHKRGATWWPFVQEVTFKIRAAGVKNWLSVSGSGYSATNSWSGVNGPFVLKFRDPLNRAYFEAHTYFDTWGSGTDQACKTGSADRLDPLLRHAERYRYKVIIGELAFTADRSCNAVRSAVVAKLKASSAVYAATFWTLGNFALYPRYMFGLSGPEKGKPSVLLKQLKFEWQK